MCVLIDELAQRPQAFAGLYLAFGGKLAALDLGFFAVSACFTDPVVALALGLFAIGSSAVATFGLQRRGTSLGFLERGVEPRLGFGAIVSGLGVIGHGSGLLRCALRCRALVRRTVE